MSRLSLVQGLGQHRTQQIIIGASSFGIRGEERMIPISSLASQFVDSQVRWSCSQSIMA